MSEPVVTPSSNREAMTSNDLETIPSSNRDTVPSNNYEPVPSNNHETVPSRNDEAIPSSNHEAVTMRVARTGTLGTKRQLGKPVSRTSTGANFMEGIITAGIHIKEGATAGIVIMKGTTAVGRGVSRTQAGLMETFTRMEGGARDRTGKTARPWLGAGGRLTSGRTVATGRRVTPGARLAAERRLTAERTLTVESERADSP